jgi:hypothetical protein
MGVQVGIAVGVSVGVGVIVAVGVTVLVAVGIGVEAARVFHAPPSHQRIPSDESPYIINFAGVGSARGVNMTGT